MDASVELAKCAEAAEKAVKQLIGVVEPHLVGVTTERFTTALLAARADALRTFGTPYRGDHGPGPALLAADRLAAEVLNRRVRGL